MTADLLIPRADARHGGAPALTRPAAVRPADLAATLPALATVLLVCVPAAQGGGSGSGTNVTAADAASAVLVLQAAVRVLRERSRPLSRVAALVLAAPTLAFAASALTAADATDAVLGLARYLQVFVAVPAALLLTLRSARDVRLVGGALVAAALVQGAVGVHQYLTGTGASYAGQDVRAVGTFGPGDVMGMSSVVSYGIVVALAAGLAPPPRAPRWLRPAALGCAALLLVPLALSFSRGAWLATAAACTVVLLLSGWRRALCTLLAVTAAGVVLVGGAGVGSALIAERLGSITQVADAPDQSVTDRYTMWDAALGMWAEHPVTGVGLKGFPDHRDSHASLGLSSGSDTAGAGQAFRVEPLLSPHNMYLLILSEQGLLGLTLVAGGWLALLVAGVRRAAAPRTRARAPDCAGLALGLLTWQLVDFLYADIGGPTTVLAGVLLGLAAWWALSPPDGEEHA